MNICMNSDRKGFNRTIVNVGPGKYRWEIRDMYTGAIVSTNTEHTESDARRAVRSTTNYLTR